MSKILIVNDSPLHQKILLAVLELHPEHKVVGVAANGSEAVYMNQRHRPDIILMDIHMPHTNGVKATSMIMQDCPTRILIVTSTVTANMPWIFEAQAEGAIDVVKTPMVQLDSNGFLTRESLEKSGQMLMRKIEILLNVSAHNRHFKKASAPRRNYIAKPKTDIASRVVVIGASTGGPNVISMILSELTALENTAILINQHITEEFGYSFSQWLCDKTGLQVKLAQTGDFIHSGQIYVAHGGSYSMKVIHGKSLMIIRTPQHLIYSPNINILMESIADVYGQNAMGIILTGMGDDGATGLLRIRQMGGTTLVQDQNSCVVDSMPLSAQKIGASQRVCMINNMPYEIMNWINKK